MQYWLALSAYMFEGKAAGFATYYRDQPDRKEERKKWVFRLSVLNGHRGWFTW
jgi:hypothetical protein